MSFFDCFLFILKTVLCVALIIILTLLPPVQYRGAIILAQGDPHVDHFSIHKLEICSKIFCRAFKNLSLMKNLN
jgi:hypothetical protein